MAAKAILQAKVAILDLRNSTELNATANRNTQIDAEFHTQQNGAILVSRNRTLAEWWFPHFGMFCAGDCGKMRESVRQAMRDQCPNG